MLSDEALRRLALIQSALVAVREEIAAHEVKVGGAEERLEWRRHSLLFASGQIAGRGEVRYLKL